MMKLIKITIMMIIMVLLFILMLRGWKAHLRLQHLRCLVRRALQQKNRIVVAVSGRVGLRGNLVVAEYFGCFVCSIVCMRKGVFSTSQVSQSLIDLLDAIIMYIYICVCLCVYAHNS